MGFEEWTTVATIVLSVVAIIIAIRSSRSTSRAANKQIRELKQLSKLQIETTLKILEIEIQKAMADMKKSASEVDAMNKINDSHMPKDWQDAMMQKHKASKPITDFQVYNDYLQKLNSIYGNVKVLKQKLS